MNDDRIFSADHKPGLNAEVIGGGARQFGLLAPLAGFLRFARNDMVYQFQPENRALQLCRVRDFLDLAAFLGVFGNCLRLTNGASRHIPGLSVQRPACARLTK